MAATLATFASLALQLAADPAASADGLPGLRPTLTGAWVAVLVQLLGTVIGAFSSRYLQGEPDTYWVQHGGGDPVEWCKRLKNRLPILHMKDYTVTTENKVTFAEIGNGNLDWKRIIPAAEAAGCQWLCIEQDTCAGDPFDSLKQSFVYTRDHICSA